MVRAKREPGSVCRRGIPAAPSADGARHGDTVRAPIDRGSGSVTTLTLIGACVVLALGGLGGATVILRVTTAVRQAEIAASAVATRALAGDATPCSPAPRHSEYCEVNDGMATVRVVTDGVVATAIAGPDL